MNTRRLFTLGSLAAALAFSSAAHAWGSERVTGTGDLATEARETGAFDGVALTGGFRVVIRQGGSHKLELRADRNLLPYIETRVVEGSKGLRGRKLQRTLVDCAGCRQSTADIAGSACADLLADNGAH